MTMNARVRRYVETVRAVGFENPRDGLVIECEVFHPKSVNGRTVLVRLTEKDRDDLLVALRAEAVRARRL